jgi:hypothetical protein
MWGVSGTIAGYSLKIEKPGKTIKFGDLSVVCR